MFGKRNEKEKENKNVLTFSTSGGMLFWGCQGGSFWGAGFLFGL